MKPSVILAPNFRTMDEIFRPGAVDRLESLAQLVWAADDPMPQDLFEEALRDTVAVVFGTWHYGDALRRRGPELRAVLEVGGAHDHHDLGYDDCFASGIEVGSAAPAFGAAVAELGLGLALAVTRGIAKNDRDFRSHEELWLHAGNVGYYTLFHRTVGFVGCGGLSRHLQRLLEPFDVRILGFDPYLSDAAMSARCIDPVDLETMFLSSEVVFILAAPSESGRGLVDRHLMELLQPHQTMILLSRASLVDFDSLTEMVLGGRFRVGIDVYPQEPLPAGHALRDSDAAVLSSHRAGAVSDALLQIGDMVVADLEAIIGGSDDRLMQYLTGESFEGMFQPPAL